MKLARFIKDNQLDVKEVALKLRIKPQHLYNILRGDRRPSDSLKVRIARETNGYVMPADWFDLSNVPSDANYPK